MEQIREIGRVRLDYQHYSGQDYYSDGEVEEQILEIVQNNPAADFPRIIEEQKNWPIFYHLSHLRENVIEWLPLTKDSKVLEIGAGCGALTGKLAEKAGEVVCVELSDRRSRINAHRHQAQDNITIHVGNFQDIEPELPVDFDFILLIGVFEYSCLYMDTTAPYEDMLRIMQKHLGAAGCLVIAIENRLGLKYWAGCREDHLGTFFSGIEGYPEGGSARTFTRKGLEKLLSASGIGEYSFYYPYPDYKFMTTLYSDKRLPVKGELTENIRNFDRDRLILFREKYAFDNLIEDGLFPDFSNSYLVVTGKSPETAYVRYSNDRAREYAVRTEITGGLCPLVRKTPLFPEAAAHVKRMEETYRVLCEKYRDSGLAVNRCSGDRDGVSVTFEYLPGETLAERMDRCLELDDIKGWEGLFARFLKYVGVESGLCDDAGIGKKTGVDAGNDAGVGRETSVNAENDVGVSAGNDAGMGINHDIDSEVAVSVGEEAVSEAAGVPKKIRSNYDFVFSNIMISAKPSEQWTLIDYEWVFDKVIPPAEIAFRALYCYCLEEESRNKINPDLIMARMGITPEAAAKYRENEKKFQRSVNGQRLSIGEIRDAIGNRRTELAQLLNREASGRRVQIYYDRGNGFSEVDSACLSEAYQTENEIWVELSVDEGIRALRLDPADRPCMVKIKQLLWNGAAIPFKKKLIGVNGKQLRAREYVFSTTDPNITLYVGQLPGLSETRLANRQSGSAENQLANRQSGSAENQLADRQPGSAENQLTNRLPGSSGNELANRLEAELIISLMPEDLAAGIAELARRVF